MDNSCLLTILDSNQKLNDYYSKMEDELESDQSNLNLFSKENEKSFRRKYIWNQVLKWCKKILIILITTTAIVAGGMHLLPDLKNNLRDAHKMGINLKKADFEAGESTIWDIKLMIGKQEDVMNQLVGGNHNQHGGLMFKVPDIKATLIHVLKKLSEYDLILEIYRTNILLIEDTILKRDAKSKKYSILNKMFNITKKMFIEIIEKSYSSFALKIKLNKKEITDLFKKTATKNLDKFEIALTSNRFNKTYLESIYTFFRRMPNLGGSKRKEVKYLASHVLFATITEFDKLEEKISPLIVKLNSYMTRLNLLLNLSSCEELIEINTIRPVFGSLISKLILMMQDFESELEMTSSDKTDTLRNLVKNLNEQEPLDIIPKKRSLQSLVLATKGISCSKNSQNPICKNKTNKDGMWSSIYDQDKKSLYESLINDDNVEEALEHPACSDKLCCDGISKEILNLCTSKDGSKRAKYVQLLKIQLKDKLAEMTGEEISDEKFPVKHRGGSRKKKRKRRKKTKKIFNNSL